ncbi:Uncharacterized protein dnm_050180 [Desulfonema magnum]|uniref:Uncharacterized protein n=1 Tax=Desulfonema magnum TaxID=45655 RepID=A0A975BNX3_9BACT|nr:Uncharacterized protein dnm_050180 [Desulfonema magnum]
MNWMKIYCNGLKQKAKIGKLKYKLRCVCMLKLLLDSDVTEFFPTDESINEALRFIIQAAKIPFSYGKELKSV